MQLLPLRMCTRTPKVSNFERNNTNTQSTDTTHTPSRPAEFTTDAARENARAAHWLLAGLLASLAAITPDVGGSACLGLLVAGAGVAVLVTALLAATAAGEIIRAWVECGGKRVHTS